jgi:hypothetical protein
MPGPSLTTLDQNMMSPHEDFTTADASSSDSKRILLIVLPIVPAVILLLTLFMLVAKWKGWSVQLALKILQKRRAPILPVCERPSQSPSTRTFFERQLESLRIWNEPTPPPPAQQPTRPSMTWAQFEKKYPNRHRKADPMRHHTAHE